MLSALEAGNQIEKPECPDCNPYIQYSDQDVQNVMKKRTSVDLRRDVYDDPEFIKCKRTLKEEKRSKGFKVYEVEWIPWSPFDSDEYEKYVTIDWSNSWTGWWRDLKDQWGFNGVTYRS